MTDAVTPEVKFTAQEAIHFTNESVANPIITTEQQTKIDELKALKEKKAPGKDIFKNAAESGKEIVFGSAEVLDLELRFGGGKAKESSTPPPHAEIDSTEPIQERANFNRAKKAIDEANFFIQYSSIQAEALRTGKSEDEVIRERVTRGEDAINNMGSYNSAREISLDAIVATGTIQRLLPELGALGEADRRNFIEATIARDPHMRNKVAKALKDAATEAQKLKDIDSDEDYKKAKEDLDINRPKLDALKDDILNAIKADISATPPLTPAQEDAIKKLIDDGQAPETIIRSVKGLVLNNANISKFDPLNRIFTLNGELAQRRQMLATTTKPGERTNLQTDIDKLQEDINRLTADNSITPDELNNFSDLLIKYSAEKDAAGVYVSGLTQKASEGSQLSKSIKENEDLIKRKGADSLKKERGSRNDRLMKEAEIIDSLDNIFSDAVVSTLEKRYDEMVPLEQARLQEEAKKTGTEDDKAVLKGMENRWISFDRSSRQKVVNQDRIRQDMRMLAYEGDDGIKRLMLRELNFLVPRLDASGNPVLDAGGQPIMEAIDYNSVDLSTLSDEHKKRLDDVYARHGNALRDKLFKDSFMARTRIDRLKDSLPGGEKMGLADHEWQMLEEKFSGKLAEAIAGSSQAQGAIKNLEAQGIKPNFKMKWLLYVMLGLGLAVPAIGIGGAAIGVLSRR